MSLSDDAMRALTSTLRRAYGSTRITPDIKDEAIFVAGAEWMREQAATLVEKMYGKGSSLPIARKIRALTPTCPKAGSAAEQGEAK